MKTKGEILEVKHNITDIRNAIKGLEDKPKEIAQKLKQKDREIYKRRER